MPYSPQEQANLQIVKAALAQAAQDFPIFFQSIFAEDVEWSIAGHGPVARTYSGMKDLFENAEDALFRRLAEPLRITTRGVWADGDEVFARIDSASRAIDGEPYRNGYMYIMTLKDGKVVSGIEWLDLNAYYGIIERVKL
ncbi:nuclear transport factor 2 family protein [Pseudoroseomonas cervicalis]|uniref:nuclear transport factor 2 family protein n=1 Tax=Teichococcus cervicalis TaxID=204525 RepID=UPI00277F6277|nr:nuclear transport factor 2 family protein [Pseudoroseomonas cervicalis]MDQ1081605.1 ketosteroid isomerase-like protein [Pseudoroseomonas cervicalis]